MPSQVPGGRASDTTPGGIEENYQESRPDPISASQQTIGTYYFDGDGKRVKKVVPSTGEVTVFVYDASAKLIAEYSTIVQPVNEAKVQYLTDDYLGSPRINTDANGTVTSRTDYMPYGQEIVGLGGRSSDDKYTADDVRPGFTGYERDTETELDFAQARFFNSGAGRFSSPDPVAGECLTPQSLNKYAYAWNNPLVITDPTGLTVSWEDSKKKKKKDEEKARTNAQREYENHIQKMVDSKDKKTHEKGLKLQAEYQRLKDSDITFHVVKNNPSDASSGELTYAGQPGHLYVNLKGDSSEYGAIPLVQKLAHEFKHGIQFLDGQLGFAQNSKGKWEGYRDDLVDEAEAWSRGFDAQVPGPDQTSGSTGKFMESVYRAYVNGGVPEIVKALDRSGPYKGRATVQIPITNLTPTIYAIPKQKSTP